MAVKGKRRGRPVSSQPGLSAERIIEQAHQLLLSEARVPSLRSLAAQLQVDVMALYHYFPNKAALLEALCCTLVSGVYQPEAGQDWRQELTRLSRSYLQLLADHSGLLQTLLSMTSAGPAQVFGERFEQALAPLALDSEQRQQALCLLVDYLHGFALALHAAPGALSLEDLDGPLGFYLDGLALRRAPS
ncbi:Tetracyclin repressor, C-terminal all-alpha domain [Ferrimonas sediminum]|uniref:Tetracyclin repressor, C-terminal all-alpha domain n=1 Tax=Ferrimonas sediminum TaxID=718193 RepID=A0A1G8Q8P1_9GAMM|nr:TetR/AcrR family transcriptional regulator [Ferrimonas sediminum]SDJ01144.1 Tetracyclin repressor, C-terminal all-alpha domain [Ferrimonas sediminum]